MGRYEVTDESYKEGRKKIKQFAIWDKIEGKVIVRYATRREAEEVLIRYQSAVDRAVS